MARVRMQLFELLKPAMSVADRFNTIVDQLVAKLYANFPLPESGREVVRDIVQKDIANRYNDTIQSRLYEEMRIWHTPLDIKMPFEEAARDVFKRMPGGYSFLAKKRFASAEELLEYHKEEAVQCILTSFKRTVEEPIREDDCFFRDFVIKAMRAIYQSEP